MCKFSRALWDRADVRAESLKVLRKNCGEELLEKLSGTRAEIWE